VPGGAEIAGKSAIFSGFHQKVLERWFFLNKTVRLLLLVDAALTMSAASKGRPAEEMGSSGAQAMVTVKSSQKIFTDYEVASLTGICVEHLHNFAKKRHLGFIARAAEAAGRQADQWLFTLSDLMVLTTLFEKCSH
jgi:hypothetical protein